VGEATTGVEPRKIEREIEHLRTRLDRSLAEVDRRRHELTDLKLQVRRHPRLVAGTSVVVLALLGGVGFAIWRALDPPHEVARRDAPAWEKILAAVGTTIAVSLTKKLLDRAWNKHLV